MSENHMPYHPRICEAWDKGVIIVMPYYGEKEAKFRIVGLDFGYDVAELECIEGTYEDERQSISLRKLLEILNDGFRGQAVFYYVSRWFDDEGEPHYFGIYSKYATLKEARRNVVFTLLDVEPDIVYQATDEQDMHDYLSDVGKGGGHVDNWELRSD